MTNWLRARRLRLEPLWGELREPLTVLGLVALFGLSLWIGPIAATGGIYLARRARASIDRWLRYGVDELTPALARTHSR